MITFPTRRTAIVLSLVCVVTIMTVAFVQASEEKPGRQDSNLSTTGAVCPGGATTPRALLAGDSWAQYMWDDDSHNDIFDKFGHADKRMVSRSLDDDPGPGYSGPEYAISGSEARQWVDTANYPWIANMIADLEANPTIDTVVLSIGGNDVLAGRPDDGWYKNMDLDEADAEKAFFDRLETDTWTIIDASLAMRPGIETLISSYDYPNFDVGAFWCLFYACGKREDLSRDPDNDLITDQELNAMMVEVEERRIGWTNSNDRVPFDNSIGLMHHYYGDGESGPGVLPHPGTTPPDYEPFPGGNPLLPTLRENFRSEPDPIHLDYDGYQYKITNQTEAYFFAKFRGGPSTTFVSQGGGRDGWTDGSTAGVDGIRVGDTGADAYHGIISFDTSSLPDGAIITDASLYMLRSAASGENPFTSGNLGIPIVDIARGSFGAPEIEISDDTATADAADVGCTHGSVKDNFYALRVDITNEGLSSINDGGLTQIRLAFPNTDASEDVVHFNTGDDQLLVGEDRFITKTRTMREPLPNGETYERTLEITSIVHQGLAEIMGSPAPFLDVSYCLAPDKITDLSISQNGESVELNWSPVEGADAYEVWHAVNNPYFAPGDDCEAAANCQLTTTTSAEPEHGLGDASSNYSYIVRARNDCGGKAVSPDSGIAGEFDFDLSAGI